MFTGGLTVEGFFARATGVTLCGPPVDPPNPLRPNSPMRLTPEMKAQRAATRPRHGDTEAVTTIPKQPAQRLAVPCAAQLQTCTGRTCHPKQRPRNR